MIDGAKLKDMLKIPPAPLHLGELPVSEGDVLGRERGVRRAKKILVVQLLILVHGFLIDAQESAKPANVTSSPLPRPPVSDRHRL